MRLYPPAPVLTRVAAEDITLGNMTIAKDTLIVIPIYAIHRHRRYWEDPDRFDPDRFLPEREAGRPRAQFMPIRLRPADVHRRGLRHDRGDRHPGHARSRRTVRMGRSP